MHTGDKKEQPATPQPAHNEAIPASSNSQEAANKENQGEDETASGDYVVVGSGLGIDE